MIQKVSLFNTRRDFFIFLAFLLSILTHSLYLEYKQYQKISRFNSFITTATVEKQYIKTKNKRTYQVLKLKSNDGFTFYTKAKKNLQSLRDKEIKVVAWSKDLNFYSYLNSFFGYIKILSIEQKDDLKSLVTAYVDNSHTNTQIAQLYNALYFATSVDNDMQLAFSNLGVSHIVAISGFHLGIITALLYFLIKPLYNFAQNRYFPYRNANSDIFLIALCVLFAYVLFLDSPPSLVRSFGMFVVGFILYDRGIEVISMQTLLVTILLLLAFFPRLFFAIGFWLSALGVFYIFLFVIYNKTKSWLYQLVGISIMVYFYMVPISLYIFGNFSIYHPISIILSMLFSIFYPLSMFLHIIGQGDLFDNFFIWLLELGQNGYKVELNTYIFLAHFVLSFVAIKYRYAFYMLNAFSIFIFIYAIYKVAQL